MIGSWQELTITYSMKEMQTIREALVAANIRYKVKTSSRMGTNRSSLGTNQINLENEYEYRIFVKKQNLEEAKFLV